MNVGAGLAIGLTGIGTGIAQSRIGAAVVGAVVEKPEMFGLTIVVMALPELIVIFGFAIAWFVKAPL